MSYKITYASFGEEKKRPKDGNLRSKIIAALLVTLLVTGAMTVKNRGLKWVTDYLLPGDPAVTAAALEDMVSNLKEGDSLYNALDAFCRKIVEHGTEYPD